MLNSFAHFRFLARVPTASDVFSKLSNRVNSLLPFIGSQFEKNLWHVPGLRSAGCRHSKQVHRFHFTKSRSGRPCQTVCRPCPLYLPPAFLLARLGTYESPQIMYVPISSSRNPPLACRIGRVIWVLVFWQFLFGAIGSSLPHLLLAAVQVAVFVEKIPASEEREIETELEEIDGVIVQSRQRNRLSNPLSYRIQQSRDAIRNKAACACIDSRCVCNGFRIRLLC